MSNPYMAFCAQTRGTAAWKARAKGLGVAEQGVLLGQLYRGRAKPKPAKKAKPAKAHTVSFTVRGEPRLTPKEEKRNAHATIRDHGMGKWIEGSLADTCAKQCLTLFACDVSVTAKDAKDGYRLTFHLAQCDEDVQTVAKALHEWLRTKFDAVVKEQ